MARFSLPSTIFVCITLIHSAALAQSPIPGFAGNTMQTYSGGGPPSQMLNSSYDVFVSGNYAYVTTNDGKFGVVDVTAPELPLVVGILTNGTGGAALNNPQGLCVVGNYAFVAAAQSNALEIIDVTVPASPVHKGKIQDTNGGAELTLAKDVIVVGNYAYVLAQSHLEIIDVTDKALPTHVSKLSISGSAFDIVGNYAYITNFNTFTVIDISVPATPTQVSTLSDGQGNGAKLSFTNTVEVIGNYAFLVSQSHSGLEILDISNPAAVVHYASIIDGEGDALLENPFGVAISDDYAYVVCTPNGSTPYIEVIDISNPLTPAHETTVTNASSGAQINGQINGLVVTGNFMFMPVQEGLQTLYLFTPTPPKLFTPVATQTTLLLNWNYLSTITSYTLDVSTDNFATFLPGFNGLSVPNSSPQATVTGLTAASEYKYRLKATNANGTSDYATATAYTTANAPVITLNSVTSNSFTVSWTPTPGADYRFYYDTNPDILDHLQNILSWPTGGQTSITIPQLNPASQYYVAVVTYNSGGAGAPGMLPVMTTPNPPTIADPADSYAANSQTSFKVTWTGTATSFKIDVATDAAFTSMVTGYSNLTTASATTITVDQNLSPNTTYYVRMRAVSSDGNPSLNTATKTYVTLPAAVVATASTLATTNSFRATWTEVPGVSRYYIDVSASSTFDSFKDGHNNRQVAAPASGVVVENAGLLDGSTYYYRVRCANISGISPSSNVVTAMTVPLAPVNPQSTGGSLTTLDFSWTASSGATSYFLDVATDANFTSFVPGYENKPVGNVTTVTATGLTSGSPYYFRVRAGNAGGSGASTTAKLVYTAPAAPVAIDATNAGQTSFTANWNAVTGVTEYLVDISADNTFASSLLANGPVSGATSLNVSTGLSSGTTYYYRVRAVLGGTASANSNIKSQITIPPTPNVSDSPAGPSDFGQTTFIANWLPATSATEYFVDVKDPAGVTLANYNNVSVTTGTSLLVNSGIVAGTTYTYVVRARNSAGTSPSSTARSALTQPPTPEAETAEILSDGSGFTAKWKASATATKYFITVATDAAFSQVLGGLDNQDVGNTLSRNVTANGTVFYYRVSASNASGTSPFSAAITVNMPVRSFPSIFLPTSGTLESYTIVSIPHGTTASTTLAADKFAQTWRVMHYDNASDANVDVQNVGLMMPGQGYWVNSNLDEAPQITISGSAIADTKTLTLLRGWNQIGNPFNFSIQWSDVLARNSTVTGVGSLFTYSAGEFDETNGLMGYGGGFVNSAANVTLTIPANVARFTGRMAEGKYSIMGRDIAADEWFLPIALETSGKINDLGGIGMHPDANNSFDPFDAVALPRFFNLAEISSYHREYAQPRFMRDVVKTTDTHTWKLDIFTHGEENEASILWDNSNWGNATLYLIDDAAGVLLDMSKVTLYTFDPRRTKTLRFGFGRNGEYTPDITTLGLPYPNPSSDQVTFPFIVGNGESVQIQVLDVTGRTVGTVLNSNGKPGYNEATWDVTDRASIPAGIYLYRFSTAGGAIKTGRIVIR